MNGIQIPSYKHYSRVGTIVAFEAMWLLASFELQDKDITDTVEYDRLLENEMNLAAKVLIAAFKANDKDKAMGLGYTKIGEAIQFDELMPDNGYIFSRIEIQTADLCTWASELKYSLPDELARLSENPKNKVVSIVQGEEGVSGVASPSVVGKVNKGGKPKGALAEAIEHVYRKLLNQGNTELLIAGRARAFLECLKSMATEDNKNTNRNADEYLLERIKEVKAPKAGKCSITTHDRENIANSRKITIESKTYNLNEVSKILNKLRITYPLPA